MIASGKSEGTCCKVPFKKDLMISRLSLQEAGILFIHQVQGISCSLPTCHGMFAYANTNNFVTLYVVCLCTVLVLSHVNIHAITTR